MILDDRLMFSNITSSGGVGTGQVIGSVGTDVVSTNAYDNGAPGAAPAPPTAPAVPASALRKKIIEIANDMATPPPGKVSDLVTTKEAETGLTVRAGWKYLKDFFDTATHPTAKFVGDKFVFNGDKVSAVQGTLTMMGKTQPVTLKANLFNCYMNPMFKREICGGDFEVTIQPTLWGISTYIPMVAPDKVRLLVQVEAIKQ